MMMSFRGEMRNVQINLASPWLAVSGTTENEHRLSKRSIKREDRSRCGAAAKHGASGNLKVKQNVQLLCNRVNLLVASTHTHTHVNGHTFTLTGKPVPTISRPSKMTALAPHVVVRFANVISKWHTHHRTGTWPMSITMAPFTESTNIGTNVGHHPGTSYLTPGMRSAFRACSLINTIEMV